MTGGRATVLRLVMVGVVCALMGAACSGRASERLSPAAEARIVIQDADGNLVTMLPDGSGPVTLAGDAGTLLQFTQPTWSPDGTRVAWTEVDARDGDPVSSLITAAPDGSGRTEAEVGFPPFYLLWDPTSSRVAFLGSDASRLEMGLVDVTAGGADAATIDSGQPFYLSWNPAGDQLLVHVGAHRLDRLELDGTATPLDDAPGSFNAPVWSRDGAKMVYAAVEPAGQLLVARDVVDDERTPIVRFRGFISFVLSPNGRRVAFQVRGQAGAPGLPASLRAGRGSRSGITQQDVPMAQPGLTVVELDTGAQTIVTDDQAAAFFWSPDGARLLSMHIDTDGGATRAHWQVWEDGETLTFPRFLPTITMGRDYLPFFDQYAQNVSLWAPDGSAFTYAGSDDDGDIGIWVQRVEEGADPVKIADGVFSAWAPG